MTDAAQRFLGLIVREAADAVPTDARETRRVSEVLEAELGGTLQVARRRAARLAPRKRRAAPARRACRGGLGRAAAWDHDGRTGRPSASRGCGRPTARDVDTILGTSCAVVLNLALTLYAVSLTSSRNTRPDEGSRGPARRRQPERRRDEAMGGRCKQVGRGHSIRCRGRRKSRPGVADARGRDRNL